MDQSELVKFVGSLGGNKKTNDALVSMDKSLNEIYDLKVKDFKEEKDRDKKEDKHVKDVARAKKRSEADKGKAKGPLSQILGNDTKKETNSMSTLLLGALGLGAAGAVAFNYKDEIGGFVENLASDLKVEVENAFRQVAKDLNSWASKQATTYLWEPAKAAIGTNVAQPLQRMVGGSGMTAGGAEFEYHDLAHFARKQQQFFVQKGITGPDADAVNTAFGDIQGRLKSEKSMNDELYRTNQRISDIEGPQTTTVKSQEAYPNELKKLKAKAADLTQNRAQNQKLITELWKKTGVTDSDLKAHQKKTNRLGEDGNLLRRQEGGTVGPSGNQADQRMFSTTGYEDGMTIKRPTASQRYQNGGLVILQGHGDVPANSGIAPGTDGPGTDYQGKYKPTAEQHFVHQVNKKTALLAQKENVPISYQQSTGKYTSASHPESNWSIANGVRRKGGSAIEMHFDAYGMSAGKMIEGSRGILKGGQGALTKIEQSVQNKFGVHPASSQGWGTLMLELDSLKYARQRLNDYPRMIVDAVKNAGAKGKPTPTRKPGAALSTPAPMTGPAPNKPMLGGGLGSRIPGIGAFLSGFKSGFRKTVNVEAHQSGGVVGAKPDGIRDRLSKAHGGFLQGAGNITAQQVIIVKRRAAVVPPAPDASPALGSGGGGLNMIDAASALHRIQSGAKF